MQNSLDEAVEALRLAKECGGELDLDTYQAAFDSLEGLRKAIREYDQRMVAEERAPDGNDYNRLLEMLGMSAQEDEAAQRVTGMVLSNELKRPFNKVLTLVRTVTYKHQFVVVGDHADDDVVVDRIRETLCQEFPAHNMKEVGDSTEFHDYLPRSPLLPTRFIGIEGEEAFYVDRSDKPKLEQGL